MIASQFKPAHDKACLRGLEEAYRITPKSKGGSYTANNARGIKRLVEQALELLNNMEV